MWVKNPLKVKKILAKNPEKWNEICKDLLFMGCITGKRIKAAFGDLTDNMIFDETTKEIADNPKVVLKADLSHISDTIKRINPDIIITFGKHAENALMSMYKSGVIYYHSTPVPKHIFNAPHPAARQPETIVKLKVIAKMVWHVTEGRNI